MPQNPQWAKDLKKQGINYTVLRYISPAPQSPAPVQPQQGVLPFGSSTPIPMTISAGAGPDGVVQPNRTAMVDRGTNPPSKYHEGELITIHGNGVRNITPAQQAAMGNMQFPGTITQQSQMDRMQLPGYAEGGVTVPKELETISSVNGTDGANGTDLGQGSQQSGAPAGYTAQRTGALNTITKAPLSDLSAAGKDAVSTGLSLLSDTAQGKNQYLQNYGNKQLAEQSSATAAGNAATLAAAKRSGASTPMITTISQEATRSAENANNSLRSNIYSKQQEAALNAANNLISQGQQVRTYEDVTLPTTQQNIETAKAAAQNASRDAVYNLVKERNLAGVWGDSLVNDAQIRAQVKSMLGETATADDISREVGIIESALLDQNREVFNTQVDNTISDMIENGYGLEQVLNDETLLKKAAGYLRINDLSGDGLNKAKEEIVNRYTELGKSDSQRAYDTIVDNVIKDTMPELMENKDFTKDMMSTIGDLMTKGIIDADGNVIKDTAFDWPWNDPDTYFKYHDWNGNEAYGGDYDQAQALSVSGNGTTYKTSSGKPVTMADVNAVWNSPTMTSVDREKYFDTEGKFQMEKFLKDKGFKQNTSSGITLPTVDEYEDSIMNDLEFEKATTTNLSAFNSIYNTSDITTGTGKEAVTSKASASGKYVYYDQYGIQKTGDVMSGDLGFIWAQLSSAAGLDEGELLSPKAFADKWNNGEGWRIDDKGQIINLRDKNASGTANKAISYMLTLPKNDIGGAVKWDADAAKDFTVTADEIKAIKADELWSKPEYSNLIAKPDSLENIEKYGLKKWAHENNGKLFISDNGTPYVVDGNNSSLLVLVLWDVNQKKPATYDVKSKKISVLTA